MRTRRGRACNGKSAFAVGPRIRSAHRRNELDRYHGPGTIGGQERGTSTVKRNASFGGDAVLWRSTLFHVRSEERKDQVVSPRNHENIIVQQLQIKRVR